MGADVSHTLVISAGVEADAYRDMGDRAAVRYGREQAPITVDESVGEWNLFFVLVIIMTGVIECIVW
jgi:hypothetical protein